MWQLEMVATKRSSGLIRSGFPVNSGADEFQCRSGMDHQPVFKADDMVTVEGFDVEMFGITFPMDAGIVLLHLQDLPFGTLTLN